MCHIHNLTVEQEEVFEGLPAAAQEHFVQRLEQDKIPSTPKRVRPAFEAFLKSLDAATPTKTEKES